VASNRQPNDFNFFRDVSKNVLAPSLDAASLAALTETSWSACQIFKDELKLRKDAHAIVQEVLNGTPESVREALEKAKIEYGDNVGILLLTPTSGAENHSGRKWKHETAIRLAANAGDLYQWIYALHPALQDGEEIAAGNIHVAIEKLALTEEVLLSYTVLTPTGERVTDYITEEELHCRLSDPLNMETLKKHLPEIMAITFKRGHTTNQNLAHPEYAGTYLLNVLFEFISDPYRQRAIAQLQHLRKFGTEHGAIMSAFHELDASYTDYVDHFDERNWGKRKACWQRVGGKQTPLPKFGLQLLCAPIAWNPMPDFNNLPAPPRDARLDGNGGLALFPIFPSWLGSSAVIYHLGGGGAVGVSESVWCGVGDGPGNNRDVMRRGCEVRLDQLEAFIGEQIRLDVEYKQQPQQSLPSYRR
jgi:hypothetical protein